MKKFIRILYLIIITYILLVIFLPINKDYLLFREAPVIPNIITLLITIIPVFLLVKYNKKITNNNYKKILIILSVITFILQIIVIKNTFFHTDWDVKTIRDIILNNTIKENYYLTKYPNTLLYLAIIKAYMNIPIIGKHHFILLIINALLVNISGLIAAFTIKRFTNNFYSIIGYIFLSIITILSPWINIPYSDTFVIIIPILLIYIYTKEIKTSKDYLFIGILSILGYYLKPTSFIVFISIIIISIIDIINKKKSFNKKVIITVLLGMFISYSFCNISIKLTGFKPYKNVKSFGIIHYIKMGQNNETYGLYNSEDVKVSDQKGQRNDIKIIKERIEERSLIEQFNFLQVKTLLNFNDGTFAWGREGAVFYYKILAKKTKVSSLFQNYFYNYKKYNYIFRLITQTIWILILFLSLFTGIKNYKEKNTIIYLSLIGIILFLSLFESRARYVYCYSPIFVTAAMIGLNNLRTRKKGKVK